MKGFLVFAGPNGSGKSSVRDAVTNPAEVVIDPDRIARQINPMDPRSVDNAAGRAAVSLFEESVDQGRSISMETTLTGHSAVMRMQRAKDAGYEVALIYVALHDPVLNVERVAARVRQGGHAIAPDVVLKRVGSSLSNLPRAIAIADQAIVLDNSGPTHRRVLETAAGRVTYLAEQLPGWLIQQMPAILVALKAQAGEVAEWAGQPATGVRPSLASGVFSALRPPEIQAAPSSVPPLVSLAERLSAFEQIAAGKVQAPGATEAEPGGDLQLKTSEGQGPDGY